MSRFKTASVIPRQEHPYDILPPIHHPQVSIATISERKIKELEDPQSLVGVADAGWPLLRVDGRRDGVYFDQDAEYSYKYYTSTQSQTLLKVSKIGNGVFQPWKFQSGMTIDLGEDMKLVVQMFEPLNKYKGVVHCALSTQLQDREHDISSRPGLI